MNKISIKEVLLNKVCDKNQIEKNVLSRKKRSDKNMKKKVAYILGGILVVLLIGGLWLSKRSLQVNIVNYQGFLTENEMLLKEKGALKKGSKGLDTKLKKDEITIDNYLEQKKQLKKQIEEISKRIAKSKQKYDIKDNLDLKKVKFSDDPKRDQELKELYLKAREIEKQEDELDLQEEKLLELYRNGKISKQEYITKKVKLELQEDELDALEDEYDKLEDEIDKLEDEEEAKKDKLEDELDKLEEEHENIENIEYEIINDYEDLNEINDDYNFSNCSCTSKGYCIGTLTGHNRPIVYKICMGEKPTGGYSIKISKVEITKNRDVKVIVEKHSPAKGEIVTQAFTYPECAIEFEYPYPNSVKIVDKNGNQYGNLSNPNELK